MKLTIIPSDGAVYINNIVYSKLVWEGAPSNVHALQWKDDSGWVEFNDGSPNQPISVLPDWVASAQAAWESANNPPPPTPEEIQQQNRMQARALLNASDWSQLADVNLANKDEWITYRATLRNIAANPPTTAVDFPSEPATIWA